MWMNLIGRKSLYNIPVKKSGIAKVKAEEWKEWSFRFVPLQERIHDLAAEYVVQKARSHYHPYVEAHRLFSDTIEQSHATQWTNLSLRYQPSSYTLYFKEM